MVAAKREQQGRKVMGRGLKEGRRLISLCAGPAREGEGREPRHLTAKTAD